MNKNAFYSVLYVAEYVGFIAATILVLVFQFTADQTVMVLSLVLYVVAFALLTFSEAVGIKELMLTLKESKGKEAEASKEPSEKVEQKQESAETEKELTTSEIKGKIRWGYAKTIMCGLISLFALLVLILF